MKKYRLVGHYRLSDKAIRNEGNKWCNHTGVNDPRSTGVVVLHEIGKHSKYHEFFYYDRRTLTTAGAPEFRCLDSYFTKIDSEAVIMDKADVQMALSQTRCTLEDLLENFQLV